MADRQHGVVSRGQLLRLGATRRQLGGELDRGRMRRLHRGVYVLGPGLAPLTKEIAAVLACSPRAALSHDSAARVWGLFPAAPTDLEIHVAVAGRNPGKHPGIRVHRTVSLLRGEVTRGDGIPITTPARTLLDIAPLLCRRQLERAVAEGFALRLTDRRQLLATTERHPGRAGTAAIRTLLEAGRTPARTRSRAERILLAAVREAGLPEPEVNAMVGRWEVDLLWRGPRVAVEFDGYASHSSPRAFARDHAKTAALQDAGFLVLRVIWSDLSDGAEATIARISRALRRGLAA